MRICIADLDGAALESAKAGLLSIADTKEDAVLAIEIDVSSADGVKVMANQCFETFGDIAFVMNNAAAFQGGDALADVKNWHRLVDVNLFGTIH